jgi:TPR repeat protein
LSLPEAQRTFNVDVNAPDVERIGQITGGFSATMYRKRFKTLAFDGVVVNEPEIILEPDLRSGIVKRQPGAGSLIRDESQELPPLTLGMSVLKYLHLFISFQERKLYISASAPAPQTAQTATAAQPPSAAQPAQAPAAGFCPPPSVDPGANGPSNPTTEDGMAAMRSRNFPLAYAILWPLANKGDHGAQRDLGIVLRQSCGNADKTNAVAWLKKAADAGDAQGAAVLGDMYEYGDGITKNMAEAFRLLTIGANAGILPAQVDLGELYMNGNGVGQDRYQGIVWKARAAEKGAPIGLIHIAREYSTGQALPKDPEKAALYMLIGFGRLGQGRKAEFQQLYDRVTAQVSKDKLAKLEEDAKAWKPAEGSLAGVLADAAKQRGH